MEDEKATRFHFESFTFSTFKDGIKDILKLAWILGLTVIFEYFMLSISVFFCSRLGQNEMAAITLAVVILSAVCITPGAGLMSVCNTYFSVGHGANEGRQQGIFLQKAIFLSIIASLLCGAILINIEDIFLLFQHDSEVIRDVGIYVRLYIIATPAMFISLALSRLLQCRDKVPITVWALFIGVAVDLLLNVLFVSILETGFSGSAVATIVAQYVNLIILAVYVYKYEDLIFFSLRSLDDWLAFFSIAFHGCITIEVIQLVILVIYILAGQFGALSVAICGGFDVLTLNIYLLLTGMNAAVTIVIGQLIGKNHPIKAKVIIEISFILMFGIALIIDIILIVFRDYIGYIYTTDREIIMKLSNMMPLALPFVFSLTLVTLIKAILQAVGRQNIGTYTTLLCNGIGLVLSVVFGFVLEWKEYGLWAGIVLSNIIEGLLLIPFLLKLNWAKEAELALERCRVTETEELQLDFYEEPNPQSSGTNCISNETNKSIPASESSALIDTPGSFKLSNRTIVYRWINFLVPFFICFGSFVIYFSY